MVEPIEVKASAGTIEVTDPVLAVSYRDLGRDVEDIKRYEKDDKEREKRGLPTGMGL